MLHFCFWCNLNQIEMLQKFLILNFLHNKSFRHMIRATAIGYISRVLADQAQPLWVINPRSQNCEFYVHVVSLLLFSIVLFFVRDFFFFLAHTRKLQISLSVFSINFFQIVELFKKVQVCRLKNFCTETKWKRFSLLIVTCSGEVKE